MRLLLLCGLAVLMVEAAGCARGPRLLDLGIRLSGVTLPSGETTNLETDSATAFEDELVSIGWTIEPRWVAFVLVNKRRQPIKILWDESSFIDTEGFSHKIIHSKIRFIDSERGLPASIIAPSAKWSDFVLPSGNARWRGKRWRAGYLLGGRVRRRDLRRERARLLGAKFGVLLVLETDGQTEPYTFLFEVIDSPGGKLR